jgi:hypothetical protein
MPLDIKFGVYVNPGTFKSIMNRYEKKHVCTTLQLEINVRETGSMIQPLLNSFFKICVVLSLRKIDAYITCLKQETKHVDDQKPEFYVFVRYWHVKNLLSLKRYICIEPSSEKQHQYRTTVRRVKFFVIW